MPSRYCVIYITSPTGIKARNIARRIVSQRWAACVNIVPLVQSLYWWKGKMESAREALLIIKTRTDLASKLIKGVRQIHPYTVPEIIVLPILAGHRDYLDWIQKETRH